MKHYIYRLEVYVTKQDPEFGKVLKKIKGFLGNDKDELHERFEMWFIKQGYDRADITIIIDNVQHANNV